MPCFGPFHPQYQLSPTGIYQPVRNIEMNINIFNVGIDILNMVPYDMHIETV